MKRSDMRFREYIIALRFRSIHWDGEFLKESVPWQVVS